MARITVEDCLKIVGDDNRFTLVHLAVERVRQHRRGQDFLVKGKNKEVVMTLREIAGGEVRLDNIAEFWKLQQEIDRIRREERKKAEALLQAEMAAAEEEEEEEETE